MPYVEFLHKMNTNSIGVAMKDSEVVNEQLRRDIKNPDFMNDIADPESIELIQGTVIVNPAHYEKQEQFLCAIDGYVQVKLVPHIYKQEVYAGEAKIVNDEESAQRVLVTDEKLRPNQSPVNFFDPDPVAFSLYEEITRKYSVYLHEGDCLFIPAFYFFQYIGRAQNLPEKDGVKPNTMILSIKYP